MQCKKELLSNAHRLKQSRWCLVGWVGWAKWIMY